jgi:hypothetical protein
MQRFEFIRLTIVVLMVAMVVGGAPAVAQQIDCKVENTLTAIAGAAPVKLLFQNSSEEPRRLYWIDYNGQRKFYGVIAPGKDRQQQSSVGNHWVVTDNAEKCLAIFVVSPAVTTFDIGFSDEPPTMN